jgi:hypothetical protein
MNPVEPCALADLEQVAGLHTRAFPDSPRSSPNGLVDYYRETFFENPWVDPRFPSLVARDGNRVSGFLGVIPRPMRLHGEPLTAAVIHRAMVDPEVATPFTARQLAKVFLEGQQDLSVSDGASEGAREMWESVKGDVVLASSIDWFKAIRPCASAGLLLARRERLRRIASLSRPALAIGDLVANALGRSSGAIETSVGFREVSDEELLDALTEITAGRPLVPEYTPASWRWLLERLRQNESRGRFETRLAVHAKGRVLGACAWYVRPDRTAEVLLLAMRRSKADAVLGGLFRHAWESGVVAVTGRLDRAIMESSWIRGCRLEQRLWTLMHSSDSALQLPFHRGDVMFTGLDYELWLRSPQDRL